MFVFFSTYLSDHNVLLTRTLVHQVTVGSRVLAHDGDGWYRAQVSTILPDGGKAEVSLLDLATHLTVDISSLNL